MRKNRCIRYKPEAKNIFLTESVWSGFRKSFGTRKKAQKFIRKIKKHGIYKSFRIKKIKC